MSNDKHVPYLSEDKVALLKRTTLKQFSEDDQEMFIQTCQTYRLDPFARQIYATRRMSHGNVTLVPVTAVLGLCALADRTGQYDGCQTFWAGTDGVWREEWLAEEHPAAAKTIVYHKGHAYPEVGIARWEAYVGKQYNSATKRWEVSDFWEKMGEHMLGKVSKAIALRGAFPDHLAGLYASEEMDQARGDEIDDEAKITQNRTREAELLKAASTKGMKVVESKPAPRPTPAEAAAPAEPPKPPPVQAPQDEPPDDLDMGDGAPPFQADAGPPAWRTHVIKGLKNPRFYERLVGDLSLPELQAIESQWLPKVRAAWEKVNSLQKADAQVFEAALAFYKMSPMSALETSND